MSQGVRAIVLNVQKNVVVKYKNKKEQRTKPMNGRPILDFSVNCVAVLKTDAADDTRCSLRTPGVIA